ncbi:hypothetical protein ACFVVQ_19320 [Paenibacillus chitinolyticus]|uniref:hypothetical protein n=1 Tax=Paenibacillus chitinolyticus TaxID=79263 RepID=UPI0036D8219B
MKRIKKRIMATTLAMGLVFASFSSVASAAVTTRGPITTDYGYGVVAHDTYLYFDNKYEAYAYIDGKALPSYTSYVDYLTGLGLTALNGPTGAAYAIISAMCQAGYGAMLESAKNNINNASTDYVYVMIQKLDNPRGGGFGYSYTYSVGTWSPWNGGPRVVPES